MKAYYKPTVCLFNLTNISPTDRLEERDAPIIQLLCKTTTLKINPIRMPSGLKGFYGNIADNNY